MWRVGVHRARSTPCTGAVACRRLRPPPRGCTPPLSPPHQPVSPEVEAAGASATSAAAAATWETRRLPWKGRGRPRLLPAALRAETHTHTSTTTRAAVTPSVCCLAGLLQLKDMDLGLYHWAVCPHARKLCGDKERKYVPGRPRCQSLL